VFHHFVDDCEGDDEPLARFDASAEVHVQLELGGGEDAMAGIFETVAADVGELPSGDDLDGRKEVGGVFFGVADASSTLSPVTQEARDLSSYTSCENQEPRTEKSKR